MTSEEKKPQQRREEHYEQPLLSRHNALHAVTGASGSNFNFEKKTTIEIAP